MILPHVLPFGALRCPAGCNEGVVTVTLGAINGDPWPSDRTEERDCEECGGSGFAVCWYCREEIAVELDDMNRLTCAPCREENRTCGDVSERRSA